jgi:hypothetical protein
MFLIPLLYFPAAFFGFVLWDDDLLTQSTLVLQPSLAIFWSYDPELYIPLTFLTYQLETIISGAPQLFHITNIGLHTCNSVLVYLVLKRWNVWAAVVVSILWGVHPLNVEAVAWISARKDLLYSFFLLLSVLLFFSDKHKASVVMFGASLMSKVSGVVLPVVMVLYGERKSTYPYFILAILFGIISLFGGKDTGDLAIAIPALLKGLGLAS